MAADIDTNHRENALFDRKLPKRLKVLVSAYLGCAAAGAVAAMVFAGATAAEDASAGTIASLAGRSWLRIHAGPLAAVDRPFGFLAHDEPGHHGIWLAIVAFNAACIGAHPIRPGRRSAVVTTLGMVLWFFLSLVLGLWYA